MTAEGTCGSELSELVTYHVLCNVNRHEFISIVNCNSMTYKIRRDQSEKRDEPSPLTDSVEDAKTTDSTYMWDIPEYVEVREILKTTEKNPYPGEGNYGIITIGDYQTKLVSPLDPNYQRYSSQGICNLAGVCWASRRGTNRNMFIFGDHNYQGFDVLEDVEEGDVLIITPPGPDARNLALPPGAPETDDLAQTPDSSQTRIISPISGQVMEKNDAASYENQESDPAEYTFLERRKGVREYGTLFDEDGHRLEEMAETTAAPYITYTCRGNSDTDVWIVFWK